MLAFNITTARPFTDLDGPARSMLMQMWDWLEHKGLPVNVTDQSLYSFARLVNADSTLGEYVGAMEVRTTEPPTYRWLQAIYVDPACRRQGIGDQLVRMLTTTSDIPTGLGTQPGNIAMQELAQSCGFVNSVQEYWHYPKS